MKTSGPVAPKREEKAAARQRFQEFLIGRIGSEPKAADFLTRHLLPALHAAPPRDETMVIAWFTKTFRAAFLEYVASHLAPDECARAWLAGSRISPPAEEAALRAGVGHIIDGLSPANTGVLRQIELGGASLWAAGVILDLNAHVVWARLRNGRAECRARLVQFLWDCATPPAFAAEERMAVGE